MANVQRLPSGKYRVRWRDGQRGADGKLIMHTSVAVKTKLEAATLARGIAADLRRAKDEKNIGGRGHVLSLEAVIERWAESRMATGEVQKGRAFEVTSTLLPLVRDEGWATTAAVSVDVIDRWRIRKRKEGKSENALRYLLTVLKWAAMPPLRQAVDPGIRDLSVRRMEQKPPPPLLTDEQILAIIALARERGGEACAAIVAHLATYGCRPVDVCKVRVDDFDQRSGMLTLRRTKNGSRVTHPLLDAHRELYARLVKDRSGDAPLFLNRWGEAWRLGEKQQAAELTGWYRDNVSMRLLPAGQQGIYCLKDYAITKMVCGGIDDRTIACFTGHRTLAVLARYKATNVTRAQQALARMSLPGVT